MVKYEKKIQGVLKSNRRFHFLVGIYTIFWNEGRIFLRESSQGESSGLRVRLEDH